ncbi:ABC transporter permease [Clostridium sartagoforme]|uniref:ABC transporter permease n=1 Tax=Clostridium sartagoforme TaxID=84031 RepID=A0A4V3RLE3_9CLOT|nr:MULTISPECIES: ABC transporter permease [Clostridium]MBS5937006.1 ABC transporter permease [Clostridium sp.]TGY43420.1 ABC transporter permease [Clostridium sartagoforme]
MKKSENIGSKLAPIIFVVLLLIIWQVVVTAGGIEKYIMPAPTDVIKVLVTEFKTMIPHILATLYEGMVGFLIAIVLSIILAIIMDRFSLIKKALYPVLVISQTIPTVALAPLFIIWFGFGALPKIIVVVIVCFFPIVISIVDGLEGVDKDLINHFKLMGASKLKIFLHLKLPYGMINFFSGMRIAATYSIMGAVIGEWLGGDKGLGVYMTRARSAYALDKMFAAIVIIVVISMAIFLLVSIMEKVFTPWNNERINNKQG